MKKYAKLIGDKNLPVIFGISGFLLISSTVGSYLTEDFERSVSGADNANPTPEGTTLTKKTGIPFTMMENSKNPTYPERPNSRNFYPRNIILNSLFWLLLTGFGTKLYERWKNEV